MARGREYSRPVMMKVVVGDEGCLCVGLESTEDVSKGSWWWCRIDVRGWELEEGWRGRGDEAI
jgi:hypothetical protein